MSLQHVIKMHSEKGNAAMVGPDDCCVQVRWDLLLFQKALLGRAILRTYGCDLWTLMTDKQLCLSKKGPYIPSPEV